VIVRGKLPAGGRKRGDIEMYDHARYLTVTGNHLPATRLDVEERTQEIAALHAEVFPTDPNPSRSRPPGDPSPRAMRSCSAWARRWKNNGPAFVALYDHGHWEEHYPSPSEADLALCGALAFLTNGDATRVDALFRSSALFRAGKWDRKLGDSTYGQHTINRALSDFTARIIRVDASGAEAKAEQPAPDEGDRSQDAHHDPGGQQDHHGRDEQPDRDDHQSHQDATSDHVDQEDRDRSEQTEQTIHTQRPHRRAH
jgi:primase-polymerase (primpol)-like protein